MVTIDPEAYQYLLWDAWRKNLIRNNLGHILLIFCEGDDVLME